MKKSTSVNRRILCLLAALWGGMVVVGAIGYTRLAAVQDVSENLVGGAALSARAALEVEAAVQTVFTSTYSYCSYMREPARNTTHAAIQSAQEALKRYGSLSPSATSGSIDKLDALVREVETHAVDCLDMADAGMAAEELSRPLDELRRIQVEASLALRQAASREQQTMVEAAAEIERVTAEGLNIFVIGSLASLMVALAVGYRLSRSVIPPINALTRASEEFSAEDPSSRVTDHLPGEFDILAQSFNTMADRIQAAVRQNAVLLQSVRESREKFRDLYDGAPDGYHSMGAEGTFLEVNNTELEWLGYTRGEITGNFQVEDVIAESSRGRFRKAFEDLKQTGVLEDVDVDLRRKDGSEFPVRINSRAVFGVDGRFLRSRDTLRDTTREQELRRQLLQAQKLESLGTLAGGIAHDFNNLLTSIMGFSQLALSGFDPSSKTHQNLTRVVDLGDQAADLIRQLLTFSREAPSE